MKISPLTRRILAVNLPAFLVLVGAWFYLDSYRAGLLDARVKSLTKEAHLIAGALGEAALAGPIEDLRLDPALAAYILRRAVLTTGARTRLFDPDGELMLDSRRLPRMRRTVVLSSELQSPTRPTLLRKIEDVYERIMTYVPRGGVYPPYRETLNGGARDWRDIRHALHGAERSEIWRGADGLLVIGVAVPVQALKRVLGAIVLTVDSREIDTLVRREQLLTLAVFGAAAVMTFLLSWFLSRSIIRPLQRLSTAADVLRFSPRQKTEIPDFSERGDEIGDLSQSFRSMTAALSARVDAIETFAADVAHELKNPLASLRGAVETLERAEDKPELRARLVDIILHDVSRLNRLISEISDASRVDAEINRMGGGGRVDVAEMARVLADATNATLDSADVVTDTPTSLDDGVPLPVVVMGSEGRLGQVLRNLVDNAVSFSPAGGEVRIIVSRDVEGPVDRIHIAVEDQGPGIPAENLESVFNRFYSERPDHEDFGNHSGLGLSISRQIIEGHDGTLWAENRLDSENDEAVLGARFVIDLPAAPTQTG